MYGRKVKLRFFFIKLILFSLILSVFLILKSLNENVVYFKSPSDVKLISELENKKIRIGGMVKKESIKISANEINFIITDFQNEINVTYSGVVPNLFLKERSSGRGLFKDRNFFKASKILAKHDENYMPPEVKEALGKNKCYIALSDIILYFWIDSFFTNIYFFNHKLQERRSFRL